MTARLPDPQHGTEWQDSILAAPSSFSFLFSLPSSFPCVCWFYYLAVNENLISSFSLFTYSNLFCIVYTHSSLKEKELLEVVPSPHKIERDVLVSRIILYVPKHTCIHT